MEGRGKINEGKREKAWLKLHGLFLKHDYIPHPSLVSSLYFLYVINA
jgi:hypothetical protein